MNINCPHCGTEYEIEEREFGKYVTCQVCSKGFVAGVLPERSGEQIQLQTHSAATRRQRRRRNGMANFSMRLIQRQRQEWSSDNEKSGTMATVIVAALIVGIGAMIAIPVIKSAATHSTWGARRPAAVQLEEYYAPTQSEIRNAKEALSKEHQSVADLHSIGRGMTPVLLKGLGRVFDCPLCGKSCKIPSGLKYKIGEERDCLCPYCHKRFRHALR